MKKVVLFVIAIAFVSYFGYQLLAKKEMDFVVHEFHMQDHNYLVHSNNFFATQTSHIQSMIEAYQIEDPEYLARLSTYDDDFFKSNTLLVISFNQPNSSIDCNIKSIYKRDDTYIVTITREFENELEDDVTPWFFLIEIKDKIKGSISLDLNFEDINA